MESAKEFGLKPEQIIIKEHALVEGTGEAEILKGIYERTDNEITRREAEIKKLEDELKLLHASDIPYSQITREAVNQYPELISLFVARGAEVRSSDFKESDGLLAVATTTRPLSDEQKLRLKNWLRIRLGIENVTLYEITATDDK